MLYYSIGDVVLSIKGACKGEYFIVTAVKDKFVYLSNGKRFGLKNPKKKNSKHIKVIKSATDNCIVEIIEKGQAIGLRTFKSYIASAVK